MPQTNIDQVPGWTAELVAKLATSWITSADQVVAISATSGGVHSLAQQLEVSDTEALRLIELARAALTLEKRVEMGQAFDSDDRGLGANRPGKEDGMAPTSKR